MLCSWIIEIDVWLVQANIQLYHIKDKPKIGCIPQRTASTQRTHLLLEGDDASSSPMLSLLSHNRPFLPLFFPLHALSWQPCTSVTPSTFCYWCDAGILARLGGKHRFKCGDRLLAISFVFPAEQTSAEVERKINVRFRERLFITAHQSQPTLSQPSYLMESQSNRLLKVITITL